MSKKLGYRFSAIPRDRHPEWFEVPLFTRMLGHELYAASCAENGESKPIPVASDWRVTVCKLLCIESKDRTAVRNALTAMEQRGLVRVEDNHVHVVWFANERITPPKPTGSDGVSGGYAGDSDGVVRGYRGGSAGITVGNDVTLSLEKRREEERRDTRAPEAAKTVVACRAPTPLPEPTQVAEPEAVESSSQARQEYVLQLSRRGLEHTKTLSTDDMRAFRQLGEFADAQAKRLAIEPVNVIRAVLDVFFDEPKMRERGWPPRFMRDRMLECFLKHPAAQRALEQVG